MARAAHHNADPQPGAAESGADDERATGARHGRDPKHRGRTTTIIAASGALVIAAVAGAYFATRSSGTQPDRGPRVAASASPNPGATGPSNPNAIGSGPRINLTTRNWCSVPTAPDLGQYAFGSVLAGATCEGSGVSAQWTATGSSGLNPAIEITGANTLLPDSEYGGARVFARTVDGYKIEWYTYDGTGDADLDLGDGRVLNGQVAANTIAELPPNAAIDMAAMLVDAVRLFRVGS